MKKNILAISGSTRAKSTNLSILHYLKEVNKDLFELNIFEGIDQLPHFNPDLDNDQLPDIVSDFRAQISAADAVIFCSPEYVFSLPGSLKNAIEWNVSTTLFSSKPVAVIIASASGEKAFESLKLIMNTLEAKMIPDTQVLMRGAKAVMDNEGNITSHSAIDDLNRMARGLISICE